MGRQRRRRSYDRRPSAVAKHGMAPAQLTSARFSMNRAGPRRPLWPALSNAKHDHPTGFAHRAEQVPSLIRRPAAEPLRSMV
jgi:hypothetical protein